MRRRLALIAIAFLISACGSKTAEVAQPAPAAAVPDEPAAAPPPDAGPSAAVRAAPPWVFRYRAARRDETWTLRYAPGEAMIEVAAAGGTSTYVGAATESEDGALLLDLVAPTARIQLRCQPARRAIGAACNDAKAPEVELLDCYHPDFEAPMPFGPAPGVEYVVDATCNGYRLAAP